MSRDLDVTKRLRDHIVGGIHIGRMHPGDQLPSYRALSETWGVDHRVIARAYKAIEEEGLVEVRGRSGVYLAPQQKIAGEMLPDTARWVAEEVLAEAWKRRIKIPELPEFVRRCTSAIRVRTACIESTADHRHLLSTELRTWFGLDTTPVSAADLNRVARSSPKRNPAADLNRFPAAVRSADLLVTTSFHAVDVRLIAAAIQKPYVIVTPHPAGLELIEQHLRGERLTLICIDAELGDRLKAVLPPDSAERIRVVLTRDRSALDQLDPNDPLLVSTAARARLRRPLPSILQDLPALSPESAAELSHLLIRLNLEGASRTEQ